MISDFLNWENGYHPQNKMDTLKFVSKHYINDFYRPWA